MKKQIAIIQLKEKTTLLEQLRQSKANLETQLERLSEQLLKAELIEKENQSLRNILSEAQQKLSAIKAVIE